MKNRKPPENSPGLFLCSAGLDDWTMVLLEMLCGSHSDRKGCHHRQQIWGRRFMGTTLHTLYHSWDCGTLTCTNELLSDQLAHLQESHRLATDSGLFLLLYKCNYLYNSKRFENTLLVFLGYECGVILKCFRMTANMDEYSTITVSCKPPGCYQASQNFQHEFLVCSSSTYNP